LLIRSGYPASEISIIEERDWERKREKAGPWDIRPTTTYKIVRLLQSKEKNISKRRWNHLHCRSAIPSTRTPQQSNRYLLNRTAPAKKESPSFETGADYHAQPIILYSYERELPTHIHVHTHTLNTMRLSLLLSLALAALVEAHSVLVYPGTRGNNLITNDTFPYGMQWMYPCKLHHLKQTTPKALFFLKISLLTKTPTRRRLRNHQQPHILAHHRRRRLLPARLVPRPPAGPAPDQPRIRHRRTRRWSAKHV
jgi:hypothetical protein